MTAQFVNTRQPKFRYFLDGGDCSKQHNLSRHFDVIGIASQTSTNPELKEYSLPLRLALADSAVLNIDVSTWVCVGHCWIVVANAEYVLQILNVFLQYWTCFANAEYVSPMLTILSRHAEYASPILNMFRQCWSSTPCLGSCLDPTGPLRASARSPRQNLPGKVSWGRCPRLRLSQIGPLLWY